jgi:hypothetical protein
MMHPAEAVRGDAGERRAAVAGFPGAFLEDQTQAFRGQLMPSDGVASGDAPKTQPSVIPAAASQARNAATGQCEASGLAATCTIVPLPSWSDLERGRSTLTRAGRS